MISSSTPHTHTIWLLRESFVFKNMLTIHVECVCVCIIKLHFSCTASSTEPVVVVLKFVSITLNTVNFRDDASCSDCTILFHSSPTHTHTDIHSHRREILSRLWLSITDEARVLQKSTFPSPGNPGTLRDFHTKVNENWHQKRSSPFWANTHIFHSIEYQSVFFGFPSHDRSTKRDGNDLRKPVCVF